MINVLPEEQKILLNNAIKIDICSIQEFKNTTKNCSIMNNGLAEFFAYIVNFNYENLQLMLSDTSCTGSCLLEKLKYKTLCIALK